MNWADWYWIVAGDETRVWSSRLAAYVLVSDPAYSQWIADGNLPTRIVNEAELWDVLAANYPAGLPAGAGGTAAYQLDPATKDYLNRLKTATPTQIDTWLDNNTGNVAQIRVVLKMIVRVMALIVRKAAI